MNKIHHSAIIGSLFLAAFPAFGIGQHLLSEGSESQKTFGVLLITLNSFIVLGIGVLLSKTLVLLHKLIGRVYLFSRVIEATLLFLLIFVEFEFLSTSDSPQFYLMAMLALGIGSIPMCWTIYHKSLVPKWLAIWGLIGYTFFLLGIMIELMGKPWSMYFLGLGGLWELFFGVWLIVKHNRIKMGHSQN